jgi:hypothetical protein
MYFMVEEFYLNARDPNEDLDGLEATVAAVNGVLASLFFLTQVCSKQSPSDST